MDQLLQLAVEAARAAGDVALSHYGSCLECSSKGAAGPVTVADVEADTCLRSMLLGAYPDYGWLSEETPDAPARLTRRRVWIVDPLDGTREYVQQIPEFAVSVGLVEEGDPLLGVVYNPATGELFAAVRHGGAFLNGQRIFCAEVGAWEQCTMAVSPSAVRRGDFESLRPSLAAIASVGSIAYRLALVASGRAAITASLRPKNEWDVCAGDLLVREAGGETRELSGRGLVYNQPEPLVSGGLAAAETGMLVQLLARLGRR